MFFKQFKVEGLGCLSYMIGCPMAGQAIVVDPKRDIDDYLQTAAAYGMVITGIIDTHVHADHISGAQELKAATGAPIFISHAAGVPYDHKPLREGDRLVVGKAIIEVVATPGHTPHAVTLAVTDRARGETPQLLLTGDLLFVGSIGRPDLAGGELLDEQIANLYNSLHTKLSTFPDLVEIYPAHGEGSLCGSGISAKPSSTLGFERATNPYFQLSFEEFKKTLTTSLPVRPKNFSHIIAQNRQGPELVRNLHIPQRLSVALIKQAIAEGALVIDIREAAAFGGAHIPGSINVGFSPQSPTWLGMVVDPGSRLIIIAASVSDAGQAIVGFRRAGYDGIVGYHIGMNDWIFSGEQVGFLPQLSIHGLKQVLEKYGDHIVLDVRTPDEWEAGHIHGAVHVPLHELIEKGFDASKEAHISVICRTGYRANIAASLLKSRGYRHVYSVIGGMTAWERAAAHA
ncbi:MAG: MBL fold metallo-hydrolase [Desulfobacterota bacterium]|nr:MBL fold metallo-hydrolase [Thermodesulfobacteriota bacterium]